ncbi:MAG TPA: hypothetical protein VLL52_13315 [Anaerolineae bacterium]|nr:hypothetical protein [Anaerolineae bacterium]
MAKYERRFLGGWGEEPLTPRGRWLLIGGGGVVFMMLAWWGGVPSELPALYFGLGVMVLWLFILFFGWLGWHLLVRPLPDGHREPVVQMLPRPYRLFLVFLLLLNGFCVVTGAYWDEVWHRLYGVPFGEDLFWRPHMLMYYAFGTTAVYAFIGLVYLVKWGRGTWQQRFRAYPLLGCLILVGAFMMYSLPADPIWHLIYGDDIAAWSIPHLILALTFSVIFLLGIGMLLSTRAENDWGVSGWGEVSSWVVVGMFGLMINLLLQAMTTDWEGLSVTILQQRPDWLLLVTILGIGVGVGLTAVLSLRLIGAATMAGLISWLYRLGISALFGYDEVTATAWVGVLVPLVAIDVAIGLMWWWWRRGGRLARPMVILIDVLSITAAVVLIPWLNQGYAYPQIGSHNILLSMVAVVVVVRGIVWGAQRLANMLTAIKAGERDVSENEAAGFLRYATPILTILMVIFLFFYIVSAQPPV